MFRIKIDARDYLPIEVISATADKAREDAEQVVLREGKKRGWTPLQIQVVVNKIRYDVEVDDLTDGFIMVDYERSWL